jgi:hypothetical protein
VAGCERKLASGRRGDGMVGRGLGMLRPPSSMDGMALALLVVLTSVRAQAQTVQDELAIVVPSDPPAGFDRQRLLQRVQVYVGPIARVIGADGAAGESTGGDATPTRFVVQLQWPQAAMTPLDVRVLDSSQAPPGTYNFQVTSAAGWDEFERLLALKLASVLRVATAPPPPPAVAVAPAPVEAAADAATEADATRLRPRLEVGGGLATHSTLGEPRVLGALRVAFASGGWSFGVASTLTFSDQASAGASSDVLETTWAASVRREWVLPGAARWFAQLGGELGVFAARVAGDVGAQERTAYGASPLASAVVLGGYRLMADGSLVLAFGPAIDLLWTRSEIRAAAARLYDSGHIRLRAELKLGLAL